MATDETTAVQLAGPRFVEVAVPLPLPGALTYEIPEALRTLVKPGVRVAVQVGKRKLRGIALSLPAGESVDGSFDIRSIEAVLDEEAVLPPDLLRLARFVADYYLAPIGEAVQAMLPSGLPAWGAQRVWLTSAGAMASARNAHEARIVEHLLLSGTAKRSELTGGERVAVAALQQMLDDERLATDSGGGRARARYERAFELAPGAPESLAESIGRSPAGRAVVEHLVALGRPATDQELMESAGCGAGVLRRLTALGVLRSFQQPVRLSLAQHRLPGRANRPAELTSEQQRALDWIVETRSSGEYRGCLLAGVTGSGKTEVYLRAAEATLARGKSVLILVPEIALVPGLARAAKERFGEELALLHSGLGGNERHQEWERLRAGEARVVLGPRSAVFAPVSDLGLVVVDEEHESAYKQEHEPRYSARDLALFRAREAGATAVLVSATPSLESRWNVEKGKLTRLDLPHRVGSAILPQGIVVDLRQERPSRLAGDLILSQRLRDELATAITSGAQAILLRNRRGYAPMLLCRACGELFACADCGLPRTFHRKEASLVCHYCGSIVAVPSACPSCKEAALEAVGSGTERVEEAVAELFPGIPTAVLDRDEVRRKGSLSEILDSFARGETRILIGTQMVAKGHHFPDVALTSVLAADSYLAFPDFRAVERTYAQLVQLAGRAGRGERLGKIVVQTYHPDHYAIRAALEHDDATFVAEELRFRRAFHYPPFTRMIQILLKDRRRDFASAWMRELAVRLQVMVGSEPSVRLTGPAPAPFERLRGEWRFQLLLRGPSGAVLRELVRRALPQNLPRGLAIDVDPQHLL